MSSLKAIVNARLVGALLLCLLALSATRAAELPVLKHVFIVIAHRGEHRRHPENTLEAIDGAIEAGADFVEMDVRRSRDGRYVLMHDSTVDRMTDGHGRVADLTWPELARLVVRSRPLSDAAASRIPTFEEALARCHGRTYAYVDFKAGDPAQAAALIRSAGMLSQVIINDGPEQAAAWRQAAPDLPLIMSPPDSAAKDARLLEAFLAEYRPEVLDDDWVGWSADSLRAAEAAGTPVWPVIERIDEDPVYWGRVVAKGFRGAQTNRPREFIAWLIRERRR